jgi:Fur family ferric uptake transcriptional regulator
MEYAKLSQLFESHLARLNLKLTWERRTILKAVLHWKGHFSPSDLVEYFEAQDLGSISQATIYRTLKLIDGAGLLQSVHTHEDHKTYELVSAHHDHMVCLKCGTIFEFQSEEMEEIQRQVCAAIGFSPKKHTMVIKGICASCALVRSKV